MVHGSQTGAGGTDYNVARKWMAEDVAFLRSSMADNAMLIPGVQRVDARTVRIRADDFLVGYKFMRALISLASAS